MNRKAIILITALITSIIVFWVTLIICNGYYQGHNAKDWYDSAQSIEAQRAEDFKAITCVRGLPYVNLPSLNSYYNLDAIKAQDLGGNYYSKNQIDGCLYGL